MNKPLSQNELAAARPLAGRVSLITGSTSGIGFGIARALAAAGSTVVLNGFGKPEEIAATQAKLADEFAVTVQYSGADMSSPSSIAEMMERTLASLGRLDVLINNAGIQFVAPIDEFPVAKWNAIIALNLTASFHTIRLALPKMKARKWGRIVNIASAHALVASPYKSAYVAAKHGIAGLTKTVALEVATHGITMNAICPGYVWTPLVEKQIPDTAKARGLTEAQVINDVLLHAQPTKQFVQVSEVAALAAFLASDEAASITGAIIPIDGGWTAQ
jgi:3-hydroxybutyrate dehydrogenase